MANGRVLDWLLHRMELVGIRSQTELADISGVSSRTINRIFTSGSLTDTERSTRVWLARTLKVSLRDLDQIADGKVETIADSRIVEWDHCGSGRIDRVADRTDFTPVPADGDGIPIMGRVMAGGLVESFEDWDEETGLRLPLRLPGAEGVYALEIAGDSMMPAYQPGEYIILRNIPPSELRDGEDAMIQLNGDGDGKSAFKRVYLVGDGKLKLVSLNQRYDPVDVRADAVARVGRLLGKFTPPKLIASS
jgi:SOS-response transcriptional repressor LexA